MLDSAPSFDYGRVADALLLGAAITGAQALGSGSSDLLLFISNASTNPVAVEFVYSQASNTHIFQGTVVLTPFATPTPEPATLVLFGTGAAVALIRSRRFGQR